MTNSATHAWIQGGPFLMRFDNPVWIRGMESNPIWFYCSLFEEKKSNNPYPKISLIIHVFAITGHFLKPLTKLVGIFFLELKNSLCLP